MTASSVELFPSRVQLMGLPRSTTSISSVLSGPTNLRNQSIGLNRRPLIQKVQKVSRNLFGTPDPIEMKKLYEQETERQRKYILGRYNFDTNSSTDANEYNRNENSTDVHDNIKHINSSFRKTTLPTLIEHELKQYDQLREGEKQTLCRTSSEETPPPSAKICNHASSISKETRRCTEYTTLSPAVDRRQTPYIRQSLITENFNIRKSKVSLSRKTKCYRVGVITTNSFKATKNLEVVPHLLEDNACNIKNEEGTKSICNKACVCTLADNHGDSKSAVICEDKHTEVSLQLVVSTKNLS